MVGSCFLEKVEFEPKACNTFCDVITICLSENLLKYLMLRQQFNLFFKVFKFKGARRIVERQKLYNRRRQFKKIVDTNLAKNENERKCILLLLQSVIVKSRNITNSYE